jgi:DNA-binding SARP family transcriptional activator
MPGMPATTQGQDRHRARTSRTASAAVISACPPVRDTVDGGVDAPVSLTTSDGTVSGRSSRSSPSPLGHEGHELVAVGPGMAGSMLLAGSFVAGSLGRIGMNPLPIQPVKIHPPLLRHDVLSRERLNGWLDGAVGGRIALIIAEAGFGKTTLLADWARHTRRATAWYRLEPDDRDWLAFIRHLVATGREIDPGFAPETYELLLALGPGGPSRDELTASIAREMGEFASALPDGLSLLFDDYHAVDASPETEPIMQALLDRTGPGFSMVIASRTTPSLPLGRLRSRRAVSRIDGDALCFTVPEAERLFRDAYHQPLDADVVTDLIDRTQGWPALVSLVHTSLEEAGVTDARLLVGQLSASQGDLYAFLAEEVIAGLPTDLQTFLTRVSLLTTVAPEMAAVVDAGSPQEIASLIAEAEKVGLLSRPDRGQPHRFHPLVRDFLRSRLEEHLGHKEIIRLHRAVASAVGERDWEAAAWHLVQAGDSSDAGRVIDEAIPLIVAAGQFDRVLPYLDGSAGVEDRPGALIVRSRLEFGRGNLDRATTLAHAAVDESDGQPLHGTSLLNLASLLGVAGFEAAAVECATQAMRCELTRSQRLIAKATVALWEASREGDLESIAEDLRILAAQHAREGHRRHAGISRLNLATALLWIGDAGDALAAANTADMDLAGSDSTSVERVSALVARARALAHLGQAYEAECTLLRADGTRSPIGRDEAALERASILSDCGPVEEALAALARVDPAQLRSGYRGFWAIARGHIAIRMGDLRVAGEMCDQLAIEPCRDIAGKLRSTMLRARTAIALRSLDADDLAREVGRIADAQHSRVGRRWSDLLLGIAGADQIHEEVLRIGPEEGYCLSALAEEVCGSLHRMSAQAQERVGAEVAALPERWRGALRHVVETGGTSWQECARLLAEVGRPEDAEFLRGTSASRKALRPYAAGLIRRLAPPVYVEDLGAVRVLFGGSPLTRGLRRKVLGLLCFLSSRQGMAATRDEALEALWPELGPDTATNSLHQTIYFLRRVFEPGYREGLSAGYVPFDGEVVSLNAEIVDSVSRECWRVLNATRADDERGAIRLMGLYRGRYALDFTYDDWASAYRENLHAAVLARVEAAMESSSKAGHGDIAVGLAQAMLSIDPAADAIELELLRIYRAQNRHAAAAEQYAHYAAVLREQLGVEPPRIEDL